MKKFDFLNFGNISFSNSQILQSINGKWSYDFYVLTSQLGLGDAREINKTV